MKLPERKPFGISTLGALGLLLIYLVAVGNISAWWLIGGVFFTMAGIGHENG